jgi:hypothetical protein
MSDRRPFSAGSQDTERPDEEDSVPAMIAEALTARWLAVSNRGMKSVNRIELIVQTNPVYIKLQVGREAVSRERLSRHGTDVVFADK